MPETIVVDLSDGQSNRVARFVRNLIEVGWEIAQLPANGRFLRNRQLIELRAPTQTRRLRVAIYKIGDRGEDHRRDERRVEITTTYQSGLTKNSLWPDIILGYDPDNDVYVGLDPRRLELGGETHNASSSVDPNAIISATSDRIDVRPHRSRSLGFEYQALFKPARLSEYLFNYREIHLGRYYGQGEFSARVDPTFGHDALKVDVSRCRGNKTVLSNQSADAASPVHVSTEMIEANERDEMSELVDLTPQELEAIQTKCRESGDAAEYYAYQSERKRLIRNGKPDLADRVEWVSRFSVNKGYDIHSFETSGEDRFIEVKGTVGVSPVFFMSSHEWEQAEQLSNRYWIYRITKSLDNPKVHKRIQNPVESEHLGQLSRTPDGWRVRIN